jgi:hypothetical protein
MPVASHGCIMEQGKVVLDNTANCATIRMTRKSISAAPMQTTQQIVRTM